MEPAEDVQGRLLVSPIWRGALNLGSRLRHPRLHELPTIDLNETRRKERAENDHRCAQLAGSLRVHRADPRRRTCRRRHDLVDLPYWADCDPERGPTAR